MYEMILAQLMAKNPGVPKAVLGLLATKMLAKVTAEDQIEGAITDFESNSLVSIADYAALLQKDGDKRVADALKKAKKDAGIIETDDSDKDKDVNKPDANKLIADAIALAMKPFTDMLGTTKVAQTKEGLKALLKTKGIPETWADDVHIGDDFDPEAAVTRLDAKWTETKLLVVNNAISDGTFLRGNTTAPNAFAEASKKYGESVAPKDSGINIQEM